MAEIVRGSLDIKERTKTINALWELWPRLPFASKEGGIISSEEIEIDYSEPNPHDPEPWRIHLEAEEVEHGPKQDVYRMMCRKGNMGIVYSVATPRYAQNLTDPAVFSRVFWASADVVVGKSGIWTVTKGLILPLVTDDDQHRRIVPTEQQLTPEDVSAQADNMDFAEIKRIISAVNEKLPKGNPADETAKKRKSLGATAFDDANRL